jgi:cytochrome c peroxidase
MSEAKVELGRRLFYDTRMSINNTTSCASCHKQELAFTDGLGRAVGATGQMHPRGSMALVNIAYNTTFNWANPLVRELEKQALTPMFGDQPVELGMGGREDELLTRLSADPRYVELFAQSFPDEQEPISILSITRALAAFQRTLISADSPYDRWQRGEGEVSESVKRGRDLFFSERLECFHCHGGFNFSDSVNHEGQVFPEAAFHNTGLYNLDAFGRYPEGGQGVYELSGDLIDMGRFRAPTLRNIAVTAPYMHDGSVATLAEAIDHYAAGGRTIASGEHAGDGSQNPHKSEFVSGFIISDAERADLIAFLESLTDQTFLTNPAFGPPQD